MNADDLRRDEHRHVHIHDDHHDHGHGHKHVHKHVHRSYNDGYLITTGHGHPLIKLTMDAHAHRLDSRGLLDPVAGLIAPLAPLIGQLIPVLKGLPLVGGVISILAPIAGGILGPELGSLLLGGDGSTSAASIATFANPSGTSGTMPNASFPIVASNSSRTPMFLVSLNYTLDPAVTGNSSIIPVSMAIPIMGESSLAVLCATYDTTPNATSPLTAQPCRNATSAQNGTLPLTTSQVFAFHPDTGAVHPLWSALQGEATVAPNATTPDAPASDDTSAEPTAPSTQSVTLVFQSEEDTTADAPEPEAADPSTPTTDNDSTDAGSGMDDGSYHESAPEMNAPTVA